MIDKIIIGVDTAGCPNRCKHCWLGITPNKKMDLVKLKNIEDAFDGLSKDITYYSWYREPDFRDDYKELFEWEQKASSESHEHFELCSFWRIVRDSDYVKWLKSIGLKKVQLTLFGMEKTTDYFIGRKGAFQEIIRSIDILLNNGIAPRIQVFVNRKNIGELQELERFIKSLKLEERCESIGEEFTLFIHTGSCDGESENLYDQWITEEDIKKIPEYFVENALKHYNVNSVYDIFGQSEKELFRKLMNEKEPRKIEVDVPVLHVDINLNVYPNFTTPHAIWKMGNIDDDSASDMIDLLLQGKTFAQEIINQTPLSDMVKLFGNPESNKMFDEGDYVDYLRNQYVRSVYDSKKFD